MSAFTYQQIAVEDEERIATVFCAESPGAPRGLISEREFDAIYDHLVSVLNANATFEEGGGGGDYSSSRYVDQIPWIRVVAKDDIAPSRSVQIGLEAVQTSPSAFAVAFDYYPHLILVLPPNRVLSTFRLEDLRDD